MPSPPLRSRAPPSSRSIARQRNTHRRKVIRATGRARPVLPPCHVQSGGPGRPACAAMRTPASVMRLAMTSSPVSASEPSIAIESVAQAAQPLATSSERPRDAGEGRAGRAARDVRRRFCGRSRVKQPFVPAVAVCGRTGGVMQPMRAVQPELDSLCGTTRNPPQCGGRGTFWPSKRRFISSNRCSKGLRANSSGAIDRTPRRQVANSRLRVAK